MTPTDLLLTALLAGAAIAAVTYMLAPLLRRSRLVAKTLMTPNEVEFFGRLVTALPGFHVFPQVAFGALITDDGKLSGKARWRLRASFDRKIVDYVLCDGNMRVLALIELDDRLHDWYKDKGRDTLTASAGYVTVRFDSRGKPNTAEIRECIAHAVKTRM